MRFFICLCVTLLLPVCLLAVTPPAQPTSGPGSNQYIYPSVSKFEYGAGDLKYWVYRPNKAKIDMAPVLLYLHGWAADEPIFYEALLEHFAKKGFIVVFPKYGKWWNISKYEANAKRAFEDALIQLKMHPDIKPDLNRVIFAGHSLGTQIASRMADTAADFNYPAPKALILHEPAGTTQLNNNFAIDQNMGRVSKSTLLVILVRDDWATDPGGYPVPVTIWHATKHLNNKTVLRIPSDSSGEVALISHHSAMQTGGSHFWESDDAHGVDAIDTWGYWRPTEAAINYALYGTDSQYILGGGADVIDMGNWSDGTPVAKKEIVSDSAMDALYNNL